VEHLYPNIQEQKHAFDFLLKHTKENEMLDQLSLVRMGITNLENIMKENPSLTIRYAIYSENGYKQPVHLCRNCDNKILKLSQTIADLVGSEQIQSAHLAETLQYRPKLMVG